MFEQFDILERPRNAVVDYLMGFRFSQAFAVEPDVALRRIVNPADEVEHRAFARDIGANDGEHRPRFN